MDRRGLPSERDDLVLDIQRAGGVGAIRDGNVGSRASRGERDRATDSARSSSHEHRATR